MECDEDDILDFLGGDEENAGATSSGLLHKYNPTGQSKTWKAKRKSRR